MVENLKSKRNVLLADACKMYQNYVHFFQVHLHKSALTKSFFPGSRLSQDLYLGGLPQQEQEARAAV